MDDIKKDEKKNVSFSQFSWWLKCPHKWYLDYVKGLKQYEDSINTCFGTAIHETFQTYIKTLYTESVEKADAIDLYKMFREAFQRELTNGKVKHTEDDFTEFCFDGEDIIKEFSETATRIKHFPRDKYEFVDVELEIEVPVKNNVNFLAYVDLVLKEKNTGDIKILDFKTSSVGWNEGMKSDFSKVSQLYLYKAFYCKKYGVPLSKIDIEFFIVKRKLYEGVRYPQSRIQQFVPPSSGPIIADTINDFVVFLDESFTPEGKYIEDIGNYPKNPGERKKNCKYCPHKKIHCDQKQELT